MAFTTYRTWVPGEIVTAALLNEQLRDNGRYMKGQDGAPTFDAIPLLPAADPTTANEATRKAYAESYADTKAKVNTGSYGGDDSANKAIAHGLGVIPRIVLILKNDGSYWFRIYYGTALVYYVSFAVGQAAHAVTAPDATNFYVGNAASYPQSANDSASLYVWVAIGY